MPAVVKCRRMPMPACSGARAMDASSATRVSVVPSESCWVLRFVLCGAAVRAVSRAAVLVAAVQESLEAVTGGADLLGRRAATWRAATGQLVVRAHRPVSPATLPTQDVVVGGPPRPSGPQDVGELHQSNSTPVNEFVPAFSTSRLPGWIPAGGRAGRQTVVRWVPSRRMGGAAARTSGRACLEGSRSRSRPASRERQNVSHRSVVRAAAVYPRSTVRNAACGAIGEQPCELPVDFR